MKKVIKEFIEKRGKYIVKDTKLQNYIEDILVKYPKYKNISIHLAKEGILKELLNLNSLNKTTLKNYTFQIVDKYGSNDKLTEETIKAWAEALGIFVKDNKDNRKQPSSLSTSSGAKQNKISLKDKFITWMYLFSLPSVVIGGILLFGMIIVALLNTITFVDIYSPYIVWGIFLILVISIITLVYIVAFIEYKKDKNKFYLEVAHRESSEDIFYLIFGFFMTIVFIIIIIGGIMDPDGIKNFISNPYHHGIEKTKCNNHYNDFFSRRENYKFCIDKDKMMIISKEGKKRAHILFYSPNIENNIEDIKQQILSSDNLPPTLKEKLNTLTLKKEKDMVFQPNSKSYIFKHIILISKEPIENFKNDMTLLGKYLFGDKFKFPKDDDTPWVPSKVSYIHDLTTDNFYRLKRDSVLVLEGRILTIYSSSKEKLHKLHQYLQEKKDIKLIRKETKDILVFEYTISSVNNKEKFFKNLINILEF